MFDRKEYMKEYYKKNREKSKAIHKVWVEANRKKWNAYSKTRYETKVATVYSITNIINNKVYIGSTKIKLQKRWSNHKKDIKRYPHRPLYIDMAKFGIDNFKLEELGVCAKSDAFKCEQMQIDEFRSNGYNLYNNRAARNT